MKGKIMGSPDLTVAGQRSAGAATAAHVKAELPAAAYLLLALLSALVWLGGTSVQIWTSEMWMSGALGGNFSAATLTPHFEVLGQIFAFWEGGLSQGQIVPYFFAFGCQAALIAFSVGMELPKTTKAAKRRAEAFAWSCFLLVVINAVGDAVYAKAYGFWGALGFAVAMFFTTFCCGLLAVIAVQHAIAAWKHAAATAAA